MAPRGDGADQRVDRFVDMLDMGAEGQDRAAQQVDAVDPRPAEHDAAFVQQVAEQALVELVRIGAVAGTIAEGDDRQLRRRARIEAGQSRKPGVEIAGELELLRLRGPEGVDPGKLEGKPQAQRAEMAGELGREVGGRRADLDSPSGRI